MINRRLFLRQASVLATVASSWSLNACSPKASIMNPEEATFIDQLTQRRVTRCVGRYLIDLPELFLPNSMVDATFGGVKINVQPMAKADFQRRFDAYRIKLDQTRLPSSGLPFLHGVTPFREGEEGGVFDRAESTADSYRVKRTLELWGWRNSFFFQLSLDAFNGIYPEDAGDAYVRSRGSNVPEKLDQLLKVYSRVRGRKDDEIPTDQGDCIANGFVAGPPSDQQAIDVPYHLQGSPDVYFDFNHTTTVRERDTLLERTAKVEQEMQGSGTQTVRKGKRELNGLPYEEWLMRGPTPDRVPGTMFMLHGNETDLDPAKPFVELRLFNGFRIPAPERTLEEKAQLKDLEKATLTEEQAVALWDKVVATLRVRPGAI
ncbi:MAG: hypothetical protein E6Q94_00945 [Burkholderiaceae bacterium]|nr:MAG: hypothetical protein E6Q94_00945 [Burkholderiaceae bacterium]